MAEEKNNPEGEATAAAPAKASAVKAWLPLIASIVLMPALAFGMTKFVIVPELQKSLGIKEPVEKGAATTAKKASDAKKLNVPFNKLLVNIAGTMGQRYLLVSLSLASTGGEEFKTKLTENEAPLRDMAMGILSTKTLADLEKPGARNLIRTELINGFNGILGDNAVSEIYITEFGIQ
ncbi:MAG: flagellar basal body-associated FliL family protein [Verrucomicrobiae bacterium]|nr:flagellar basal body-associated FliL family protein [Verrucomicrobiae bacterium]